MGEARQSAKTPLAHSLHVCVPHHLDELAKTDLGRPTELLSGFRRVALEQCHFRRPVEPLVDDDVLAPIETGAREGELGELLYAMRFARRDHETIRFVLLHYELDDLDLIAAKTPAPARPGVAEHHCLFA